MTIQKFRKKPVVIEALQWTGSNAVNLLDWIGKNASQDKASLVIRTLEGDMEASLDDWIIKGVNGEFYPCKPDIFDKTYEPETAVESREDQTRPTNNIPSTAWHDEGAIARCSNCGRYTLDPAALGITQRQPRCECGEKHSWCGSFKKPGLDARWSGPAPLPVTTDVQTKMLHFLVNALGGHEVRIVRDGDRSNPLIGFSISRRKTFAITDLLEAIGLTPPAEIDLRRENEMQKGGE